MSRPQKYNEETSVISFKVPKSKKEQLKNEVSTFIASKLEVIEQIKIVKGNNLDCGCRIENNLFIRQKGCKLDKDKH